MNNVMVVILFAITQNLGLLLCLSWQLEELKTRSEHAVHNLTHSSASCCVMHLPLEGSSVLVEDILQMLQHCGVLLNRPPKSGTGPGGRMIPLILSLSVHNHPRGKSERVPRQSVTIIVLGFRDYSVRPLPSFLATATSFFSSTRPNPISSSSRSSSTWAASCVNRERDNHCSVYICAGALKANISYTHTQNIYMIMCNLDHKLQDQAKAFYSFPAPQDGAWCGPKASCLLFVCWVYNIMYRPRLQ